MAEQRELPANPDLTDWVASDNWERRKHWFNKGDLVEIYRKDAWFYNHWVIYLENGLVAHVTIQDAVGASSMGLTGSAMASTAAPSLASGTSAASAMTIANIIINCGERFLGPSPPEVGRRPGDQGQYFVRVDHILAIAGTDKFRVNNSANPVSYVKRSYSEIFEMVSQYQDNPFSYSLFRSNCEHFATFLRYRYREASR